MVKKTVKIKIWCSGKSVLLYSLFFITSCSREGITENQDDNLPPSIPANVQVFAAHDGAAGIEWDKNSASNIKGYNIYRSVNSTANLNKISFVTDSHYVDFPLGYDSTYFYAVTALNLNGAESGLSGIVNAKPVNLYYPLPIYDISINGRNNMASGYIHLEWTPQQDYDIKRYEIYKSEFPAVNIGQSNLAGVSSTTEFYDSNTVILKRYYYKIISVDKGELKSDSGHTVSDIILDTPELVFPADKATVINLNHIQFRTVSLPCRYKIVIQSNELYGTEAEFDLQSDKVKEIISFDINSVSFVSNRKYYWRVITYSDASDKPNSYSQLYSFVFVAE